MGKGIYNLSEVRKPPAGTRFKLSGGQLQKLVILKGIYFENRDFLSLNTTLTIAVQNFIIQT
jgi:hypothetical protein